jgi:hypothetical protein
VIGDPHNGMASTFFGWFGQQAYPTGDIMIDIYPCQKCLATSNSRIMGGDMVTMLQKMETDKYVIYISNVLEYIPHIKEAIKEVDRVAGSRYNTFIYHVQSNCVTAYLYPGFLMGHSNSTNIISKAPPYDDKIKYSVID